MGAFLNFQHAPDSEILYSSSQNFSINSRHSRHLPFLLPPSDIMRNLWLCAPPPLSCPLSDVQERDLSAVSETAERWGLLAVRPSFLAEGQPAQPIRLESGRSFLSQLWFHGAQTAVPAFASNTGSEWSLGRETEGPFSPLTRRAILDNMQRVIPGVILLLVKLTGTSLFVAFIPQIFPRGNISFVPENISFVPENYTVSGPQTTESISEVTIVYTTEAATTTTATAQPWKWQRYRGSYYWFSEDLRMWTIGRTECKKRGSDLVKINDRNELEFIRNKTKMAYYFIGLTYDGNKWLWNDDTEIRRDLYVSSSPSFFIILMGSFHR
ncbi:uncharacterized protein LOC128344322 isoform X2 [Hemicordylus capensis]|uniref:uncharacterized protein LOC128344322 isoform X2 n=1 Tax=Hemicordylus capensis TaxID=884348 RepID=UPI002302407B|nr:uncharacterized protein LOC128344322 isoform X2 [Hemicordylus capensis]